MAAEGAVVITATGMLGAVLLPIDIPQTPPKTLPIACESLGSTRGYITTADICYGKSNRNFTRHSHLYIYSKFNLWICL